MKISDELLERLGTYFVYHDIHERFNVTFEQFLRLHAAGVNLFSE